MGKTLFVRDLKIKEEVESVFYVKYASIMQAKDGRSYMNVILSDRTGDIEARIWSDAEKYADIVEKGIYARVQGKLNIFQGKKQFIILNLVKESKKTIDEQDFLYAAKESPEIMYEKLLGIVDNCDDYYIKSLLKNVLEDEDIKSRLKIWPAGKAIHHAYRSGLLEHILACSELALDLSSRYKCNFNYVLAGCILHDLCKIYELTEGIDCEYSDEGKLLGHLVRGPEIVDKFSYRIKGFPYYTKIHLKHILLSHHGSMEFGSPKLPQTSEAMLVHLIDFMDSKMNTFETIKRTDSNHGDWSAYVKHLDRIVFKGNLPQFSGPKSVKSSEKTVPKHHEKKDRKNAELKQNLGKMLEGFKVEGEENVK